MELDERIEIENGNQGVERWKKALMNDTREHFLQPENGKNCAKKYMATPNSINSVTPTATNYYFDLGLSRKFSICDK